MHDLDVNLVPETAPEKESIDRLIARAFGPGRFARTAERLREGAARLPDLCFTAYVGTFLAGSIRCSSLVVGLNEPAILLGPVTIEPNFQGKGIGSKLIEHVLKQAKARDEKLVFLIGDAHFYKRFGFAPASLKQFPLLAPENPLRYQVLELKQGALAQIKGLVRPKEL
jgi:predicted N-acetyltransferase YhbS